jgi:hypothetical protein
VRGRICALLNCWLLRYAEAGNAGGPIKPNAGGGAVDDAEDDGLGAAAAAAAMNRLASIGSGGAGERSLLLVLPALPGRRGPLSCVANESLDRRGLELPDKALVGDLIGEASTTVVGVGRNSLSRSSAERAVCVAS